MPNLAKLRLHTDALFARLDAVPTLPVFDAAAPGPDDKGWGWQGTPGESAFVGYAILYPIPGGFFDGPLGAPDDDASLVWQVTCVGADRRQCEGVADTVNVALTSAPITVVGRGAFRIRLDMTGGAARQDDTVRPAVFVATPRYRAMSSPGGA